MNTLASLEQVLAFAQRDLWPADALVLTGDLANDGEEGAYFHLRQCLGDLRVPVYCIAGNHDDPELMEQHLPGGDIQLAKQAFIGEWLLLFLNTQIPGKVEGHLDMAELQFLEEALDTNPHRPTLVFLHHPPVPIGSAWLDALALDNPEAFFAVLDRFEQVRGVLWGHAHQAFYATRRGVHLLGTPSTCVQFLPGADRYDVDTQRPGYRWLELWPDGTLDTGIQRLP
jgi:Icc protein